jgi:calcineurin-like phosphoesterase family protein
MARPPICGASRLVCTSLMLVLMSAGLAWAVPEKARAEAANAVVAIADVHGDYDDFVAMLQRTGLIDQQNHWIGGNTTFVQLGDILDRGPKPRQAMDLLMALQKEAAQSGGKVISLLGNHEVMNIMGDLRYVVPTNFASYADGNSEKRQKTAYEDFLKWKDAHGYLLPELPQPLEVTEAEWMARHPAGFIEQREAFSPKGQYGEWLREHPAVVDIGGIIYLHGGIHPDLAKMKIDAINSRIHDEIKTYDSLKQYLVNEKLILPFFTMQEINNVLQAEVIAQRKSKASGNEERQAKIMEFAKQGEWLSVRPDGPLWFRGYDQWSDAEGAPLVNKILDAYKASHLVVGHTVQKGGHIRPIFGGKVFLIDTGMLSSYYPGGKASALEICGDTKFVAVYLDQQVVLLDSTGSSPQDGAPGDHPSAREGAATTEKLDVIPANRICSATTATPH